MIELSGVQKEILRKQLEGMNLADLLPDIELMILGLLSPVEILELINRAYRISWLKGQQATANVYSRALAKTE